MYGNAVSASSKASSFVRRTVSFRPQLANQLRGLYQQLPLLYWLLPPIKPITDLLVTLTNGYKFTVTTEMDDSGHFCQGTSHIVIRTINDETDDDVNTDPIIESDDDNILYIVDIANVIYASGSCRLDGQYSITAWPDTPLLTDPDTGDSLAANLQVRRSSSGSIGLAANKLPGPGDYPLEVASQATVAANSYGSGDLGSGELGSSYGSNYSIVTISRQRPLYELNINFQAGNIVNSLIYDVDRINKKVRAFGTANGNDGSAYIYITYNYDFGDDDFQLTTRDAVKLLDPSSYDLPVADNYSYSELVISGNSSPTNSRINTYNVNSVDRTETLTSYSQCNDLYAQHRAVTGWSNQPNEADDKFVLDSFVRVTGPTQPSSLSLQQLKGSRRRVDHCVTYSINDGVEKLKEINYSDKIFGDVLVKRVFSDNSSRQINLEGTETGFLGSLQQKNHHGFPNLIPFEDQLYLEFLTADGLRVSVNYSEEDGSCQLLHELDAAGNLVSYVSDPNYNLSTAAA